MIRASYVGTVAGRAVVTVVFLSWTACGDPSREPVQPDEVPYENLDLTERTPLTPEFTKVAEVIERSDGSLVVLDVDERLVAVIASGETAAQRLATTGRGPGELLRPTRIFRGLGDSVLVLDAGRGVIVNIDPDDTMSDLASIGQLMSGRRINAIDGAGRIYYTTLGGSDQDSTEILRLDPVGSGDPSGEGPAPDTLGRILLPKSGVLGEESGGDRSRRSVVTSFDVPFSSQDDWAISPTGDLVVARAHPFSIEGLGSPVTLRHETVVITAADREPYSQLEIEWPHSKGAFVGGSLRLAGSDAWLQLHVRHGSPAKYVRVSKGGEVKTLALQGGERLVGAGAEGRLYLAHTDELDVERITVAMLQ